MEGDLSLAPATGRMVEHAPGVAKIGRMAVRPTMRGSGIGRAVLETLAAVARSRGDRQLLLHAQTPAAPFYRRAGFVTHGEAFDEAGIAHVERVRPLRDPLPE
jgi:predicted GNAT family N-acyltransferase